MSVVGAGSGDLDGDGYVSYLDAILALRIALHLVVTPDLIPRADIDGNGSITIQDSLAIIRQVTNTSAGLGNGTVTTYTYVQPESLVGISVSAPA